MSQIPTFAKAKDCSEQKEHLSELKEMPIPNGAANCLSGCTFVMTGTLPALTRAKAKKLIEDYGGTVSSTLTKKTNVVLKGFDEETSKKLQDAENKGIPITDQEGLFNYIASTNPNNNNDDDDIPESEQFNASNNIIIPEIKEYCDKKVALQTNLLDYIDDPENIEEKYQNLHQCIVDQNISNNKLELSNLFQLIAVISKNHFHFPNFFSKIEKVLSIFTDEIKQYYSNDELFKLFKCNKRILLYLIQNELLNFDENIAKTINSYKYLNYCYPQYFAPELKPFVNEKWMKKNTQDELPE